ncbi:hypothetical protein BGZ97_005462 [Linnemannia gamsii]|uniref:F-box domain-containing protein n=1 Tax=Linnemannia gamsii TaxID=64522 RepID=A0A9P6RF66_9FUNG|nr:hypothetical protein BGZ97_005462 [Linnemannia gamsii]
MHHQEENALDLPEIRSIIGSYLARHDLILSSQVSQAWRQSFKPLIWRETVLRASQNPNRTTYLPPPPVAVFREHGHLIRSLTMEGPISMEEVELATRGGCVRLEHLRLSATVPAAQSAYYGHGGNATNIHNNCNRRNNDDSAGPSNPVSTAGRWNLLLLVEGGDNGDINGGDSDDDSDIDIDSDRGPIKDRNEDDVQIVGVDDGESSEDSFWSSWNRSDDDDDKSEYESNDEPSSPHNNSTGPGRTGDQVDMWERLAELVLQNRATLKELEIVLLSPPPCRIPRLAFWETVVDCFPPPLSYSSSTLTSLSLVGREIKGADLMLIWRAACRHLTKLELARCSVENEAPLWGENVAEISEAAAMVMETEPRPPSALQYLRLIEVRGMMPRTQFKVFIADSPRLKSLAWQVHRSHAGSAPRERLWVTTEDDFWQDYHGQPADPLQHWLELTSLELTSGKETLAVSDLQLAILLDRAGDTMERLTLGAIQVGEATFRSMRRFFDSLAHLDLRLCSKVTGTMVQQVLASCPGLKSVAADSIHASDIIDGDPWVCFGLQSWTVFVNLSLASSSWSSSPSGVGDGRSRTQVSRRQHQRQQQTCSGRQAQKGKLKANDNTMNSTNNDVEQEMLQQCVFERLSTLTCLERLDLDRHYPLTGRAALKAVETLDWRLRKGLDKLVTLTRLTSVCLSSHQPMNMSKSAAVWMIEHWLQLEVVRGRLGERKGDHKELARLFQRNGIQVD